MLIQATLFDAPPHPVLSDPAAIRWWRIFGDGRDLSLTALQQAYGVPYPDS